MIIRRHLAAALLLPALVGATAARTQIHSPQVNIHRKPAAEDLSWLWEYTRPASGGENQLLQNPRFKTLLEAHLKAPQSFWNGGSGKLSDVAHDFLAIPGEVTAEDNRYVTATGCVQHFCPSRGLLWIDTGGAQPLVVFNAIDWISDGRAVSEPNAAYTLWMFPDRPLSPTRIPPALTRTLARWTSEPSSGSTVLANITRVFLVDPDGTAHPLTPSMVGAHTTLPAETSTGTDLKAQP